MKRNSLYWKGIAIIVIVLFIGMGINPLSATSSTEVDNLSIPNGNTLYVGGSGPNNYTKIQDAIDNASDGDTVFVYNGSYYGSLSIYKTINLTGENKNSTIIHGYIKVTADNVMVYGFTIQQGGNLDVVRLQSNYNKIYNNIILDASRHGIVIFDSSYNHIHDNIIRDGFCAGISIEQSKHNNIDNNSITNYYQYGIWLDNVSFCTISKNIISNQSDGEGIGLYHSSYNDIVGNTISNNENGIRSFDTGHSKVYHNNFINNSKHADLLLGEDNWDNGYPIGGNYWDDYSGEDYFYGENQNLSGSDGIGDELYQTYDEDITDNYPFMNPNGWDENYPPLGVYFNGPGYGKPGKSYCYYMRAFDVDSNNLYFMVDWGDGSYSDWLGPVGSDEVQYACHAWSNGSYEIRVKAKDDVGAESDWSDPPLELHIEDVSPQVKITKPVKALYIMNRKILPRFFRGTLVIGTIDITVDAIDDSGIKKVEFYIDNNLKSIDNSSPYSYTWKRDRLRFIHFHVLNVVTYDNAGNMASDKTLVRKIL